MMPEKITVVVEVEREYLHELATARGDQDMRSEVVMVLQRPGRKVLVTTKSFYPPGTYRLPSGGILPGESPEDAFAREAWEESGLRVSIESKIAEIENHCVCSDESILITSHVFLGQVTTDPPHPTDPDENISGYREVDGPGLRELAAYLRSLPGRWHGFGEFRATAHDLTADYLANLRASPQQGVEQPQ